MAAYNTAPADWTEENPFQPPEQGVAALEPQASIAPDAYDIAKSQRQITAQESEKQLQQQIPPQSYEQLKAARFQAEIQQQLTAFQANLPRRRAIFDSHRFINRVPWYFKTPYILNEDYYWRGVGSANNTINRTGNNL